MDALHETPSRVARVVVDVPARALTEPFDYSVPAGLDGVDVGVPVLVPFGRRPALGYVVGLAASSEHELKPVEAVLGTSLFAGHVPSLAAWIAREYLCPLSEALRLFLPPRGVSSLARVEGPQGASYLLRGPAVGTVDDRWAELAPGAAPQLRPSAVLQRAVVDSLAEGPVRVAELAAGLGNVDGAVRRLAEMGVVVVTRRRRMRDPHSALRPAPRHENLSRGQSDALDAIRSARASGGVVLLDGVTGSGKTEVYLRAIEEVLAAGGGAIVLVPEISLTPQTVGRFRSRFGEAVAVLHSRLSDGERYDQWDACATGAARVAVGARSALFAPVRDLALVVIDEEHETSYKQGSSPRYHARDVAVRMTETAGAALVLGSATPSMESLARCERGRAIRVVMPERVGGGRIPEVRVIDLTAEFADGNRSMFSRELADRLRDVERRREKAVVFLNRRGFASFLLCRECGFVPECDACAVSLTYHEVGRTLACHHCGAHKQVPVACPRCSSPYLRQFGAGTQRVEAELQALVPGLPIVRMDADTVRGKGGHERVLAGFEALPYGVLVGTQMVAKGLDYPEITLVGVITADTTLHMPDFRAGERTYQLVSQVAGRCGRGEKPGLVVVQTYWPDHPAIVAAAAHDPERFYAGERAEREALGYPPYGRLANVLVQGADVEAVRAVAVSFAERLRAQAQDGVTVLGPAPAPLAKVKGAHRWHVLLKGAVDSDLPATISKAWEGLAAVPGVTVACDVDAVDLL
ncbi:MAG: primosomal protein N' [Coriobacteriia bacterium]